ncbi:hypothetical protein G9A89_005569 [Geosiphon pyriformis]|nr:hypothetical protein G9A89_005569 [Geosiphon pyriformis]
MSIQLKPTQPIRPITLTKLILKTTLKKETTTSISFYIPQPLNNTETLFKTEKESYQTTPVFNLFLSKSEYSTQTTTPEPMANDSINNTPLLLFRDDAQDPIKWLDDFERAATANQYDDEYKFQIVGGYLQGSSATWFSQKTNAGAHQRIIKWTLTNIGKENTSFTTQFKTKFRTSILISKWHMELKRRTQSSSEVLIKQIDPGRNWTEKQKIHSFTNGLRTDLSYALWPLLALKDNFTIDMAIELVQRIKDNQRMHLRSTLLVFAPALLIDRLTINLAQLLKLLAQAVKDNQQPQRPKFESHFNQPQQSSYQRQQNRGPSVYYNNPPLSSPAPRNNNNQNNRINNNNVPNQRPNYANINFFEEDPLGLSVIEAARQNILATFPLKNISNKLPLVASGSFSLPLAGSSSSVKVPSKRHTQVSPSVVSTISKSPKIFNNRPVNKLVFSALTTPTTTSTITASQMAVKAKNSKKQQQAVTTAMITPNLFMVPDEIFSKISTAAASPLPDMDGNSSSTSPKMGQDQPLAVLPDVVLSSRSSPIPADQMKMESTFSGWVASNLIHGAMFKIKMALLNAVKLFCVEFASQKCLNDATKVVIGNEVFLTTLKIAWSSGMASVSSSSLSVALRNVPLSTSVKLKPAGLWQYTVVDFKDISSAAAALSNWSVLVRKDSVRILPIANQKEVISLRDAFKAKLVNLLFGCTAFEISNLVSQVGGHTCFIPCFPEFY